MHSVHFNTTTLKNVMVLDLFFGTIGTVAMTWISYSFAIVSFFLFFSTQHCCRRDGTQALPSLAAEQMNSNTTNVTRRLKD